jgi:tetrahydromethanopterin S-methyltransferase subunit A
MKTITGNYNEIEDWSIDTNGYFLIRINREKGLIEAAFCTRRGEIDVVIEGKKPQDIYHEVYKLKLISRIDHGAYLGKELEKAFIAIKTGKEYVQDKVLDF